MPCRFTTSQRRRWPGPTGGTPSTVPRRCPAGRRLRHGKPIRPLSRISRRRPVDVHPRGRWPPAEALDLTADRLRRLQDAFAKAADNSRVRADRYSIQDDAGAVRPVRPDDQRRTTRRSPDRTAAGRLATEWTRWRAPGAVVCTGDAPPLLHRVEPTVRERTTPCSASTPPSGVHPVEADDTDGSGAAHPPGAFLLDLSSGCRWRRRQRPRCRWSGT